MRLPRVAVQEPRAAGRVPLEEQELRPAAPARPAEQEQPAAVLAEMEAELVERREELPAEVEVQRK